MNRTSVLFGTNLLFVGDVFMVKFKFKRGKFKSRINKHGFELSVNFIVMLILSISALSLGIFFARNVFKTSNDITKTPVSQFESQLETLSCDSTQPICIGLNKKEVAVGRYVVYTLVINNQFKEAKTFHVHVKVSKGLSIRTKEPLSATDLSRVKIATRKVVNMDSYSSEKVPIAVQPTYGTKHGTYSILVNVTYNDLGSATEKKYGVDYVYLIVNE